MAFNGKVVLVTGGSKGIGLACAQTFSAAGARVVIVGRNRSAVDQAIRSLPHAVGFAIDLSDAQAAAKLVDTVALDMGAIDVLVNSAGAAKRSSPEELTPAVWQAAMEAKFFPTINVVDPAIKIMASRGIGVTINIIGNGGKVAGPFHLAGGAANAALMLATGGLGHAYAASGVRVVGINPGLTDTGRVAEGAAVEARKFAISTDGVIRRLVERIPIGRMARPQEVADVALFLASANASYITGITITMDGAQYPVVV